MRVEKTHQPDKLVKPTTLIELLRLRAKNQSNHRAYTFLVDGESEEARITYAQLDHKARVIAVKIQELTTTGDRALLLYPAGLDYIAAFFGCLYAGVIAVPTYPPRRNRPDDRLQAIVKDSQATLVLSTQQIISDLEPRLANAPGLKKQQWIATDNIKEESAKLWQVPKINSDTLAFLQYTSGSTGNPKGVMISHGNVLYNQEMVKQGYGHSKDTVSVQWLPIFHDMGLTFNVLQPLYLGVPCTFMAPIAFLQKPLRWLQAISRYRATSSGGPNFAYDLCVQKITPEQRAQLDLSCWQVAQNGAEPVRARTLEQFSTSFADCGFRLENFYPCYGMAETMLLVSGGLPTALPIIIQQEKSIAPVVGCGQTILEQKIAVVDPDSLIPCREGQVGEVWVSGKNIAQGYWNRPEETQQTFHAYFADSNDGPYLRTGDLGFFKGKELFITGRLKDLIIIRGGNYYPQDIELTVEKSHDGVRPNCGAAFSVDVEGEERLVIVQELERTALWELNKNEVMKTIIQGVSEHHELQVYALLLLKPAAIPKTSSGKIQRGACRKAFIEGTFEPVAQWQQDITGTKTTASQKSGHGKITREALQEWLKSELSRQLNIPVPEIDIQEPWTRLGLDSLASVTLANDLASWLGRAVSPTIVYDYPNIETLSLHLAGERLSDRQSLPKSNTQNDPIAIIGMGCRFPGGANSLEGFWDILENGIDTVKKVPNERWDSDKYYDPDLDAPGKMYNRHGGFIDDFNRFDPEFFNISAHEAHALDPQQRLLLEVSYEALENSWLDINKLKGSRTGIFLGVTTMDYGMSNLGSADPDGIDQYTITGMSFSTASGRLSYTYDLRGPSISIDTACSSSLVALDLAVKSLRNNESNMAIAGGVNMILIPELHIGLSKVRALSVDGKCKAFDESANGYVRGEGCGIIVLKRLADAKKDGDEILAVVRGSAINQDGKTNGLTAPNAISQQDVIKRALENSGLSPDDIDYIESHGTGTSLGDSIEANALGDVFHHRNNGSKKVLIGSVKTNIGHLEASAGIASVIKVILSLQHEKIPKSLHFNMPNSRIPWDVLPIEVSKNLTPWPKNEKPRTAGISSFGFSGTNAHVIIQEAPRTSARQLDTDRPFHILSLSAKNEAALKELAQGYVGLLSSNIDLGDTCYSANTGRAHLQHRVAVVAASTDDACIKLGTFIGNSEMKGLFKGKIDKNDEPGIAFLFTGQGAQYVGMAKELYNRLPVFRDTLNRCNEILLPLIGRSLIDLIYSDESLETLLAETQYTQPAIFMIEYALYQVWKSWGIKPTLMAGHSVGEYAAACAAGVFSLEDALKLIAHRGRLMQSLPGGGAMAAIKADEATVESAIKPYAGKVSIASINAPLNTVISGEYQWVQKVCEYFKTKDTRTNQLKVSHAFHSHLMEPILSEFKAIAAEISYSPPQLDLISNLTGKIVTEEMASPDYWVRHIRQPVRFAEGMKILNDRGCGIFLEVGPKPITLGMGRECFPEGTGVWLPSIREKQPDWQQILETLGELYVKGVAVDWTGFDRGFNRHHVVLPTYPFQRKQYWVNTDRKRREAIKDLNTPDFLYRLQWEARNRNHKQKAIDKSMIGTGIWLIFADLNGWGEVLSKTIKEHEGTCILVFAGSEYKQERTDTWHLNPYNPSDFGRFFKDLAETKDTPIINIIHLWSLDIAGPTQLTSTSLESGQVMGCGSVLHLVQALDKEAPLGSPKLWLVTRNAVPAGDDWAALAIGQAPLWGLGKAISLEYSHLRGGMMDLGTGETVEEIAFLLQEILDPLGEDQLAFRNNQRYVARLKKSSSIKSQVSAIKDNASYLVTGGQGALGLQVTQWLAREGGKHIVLIGRRRPSSMAQTIIDRLNREGCHITVAQADVANENDMLRVMEKINLSGPPLRGIIHAAGVATQEALKDMTLASLQSIFKPKVIGTWTLHKLTDGMELDFFVSFSSIASVWGSIDQAHYSGANQFLDAMAYYRRGNNLPALTINWGPWAGGGMVSEDFKQWIQQLGITALPPEQAIEALGFLVNSNEVQLTAVHVDWSRFKEVYELRGTRPLFEYIDKPSDEEPVNASVGISELREQLKQATDGDRLNLLTAHIQGEVASVLGHEPTHLRNPQQGFFDMGFDSLSVIDLINRLKVNLGLPLPTTLAFDYPTIEKLAAYLYDNVLTFEESESIPTESVNPALAEVKNNLSVNGAEPIAIIGMACRFPGSADSPEVFWELLHNEIDTVREIPPDRWNIDDYYDPDPERLGKTYTRYGSFIDTVDMFDPHFFGISPREAAEMDPQQRLLLEVSWEALENAGLTPEHLKESRTGLFVGIGPNDYFPNDFKRITPYSGTGNQFSFAPGRISYILGLKGPSISIDTACSSSLVSLHIACQSLRAGDCDTALTGGVQLILTPKGYVFLSRAKALSPDGRSKTFAASADGYGRGEGCGVLVLKRLSDAKADGDNILALVKGSAVNHNGAGSGITTPNGLAQQALIKQALNNSQVAPSEIDYVEAHGTGTYLGDPIEAEALGAALGQNRPKDKPLLIGSLKTNIGHLETAAGVASIIKVILALGHEKLPSNLHFNEANPNISWDRLNVKVLDQSTPWPMNEKPRIAGVSAFGLSGTNAHVVLEEAPKKSAKKEPALVRPLHVLTLSAKSNGALKEMAERYKRYMTSNNAIEDICFTANTSRSHFLHRLSLVAGSAGEMEAKLTAISNSQDIAGIEAGEPPKVVFLFTGQGAQYNNMGRSLYQTQPVFRDALDQCDAILAPILTKSVLQIMYSDVETKPSELDQTRYTQPALFALEYALAKLWMSWGVVPSAVMGHSIGEYSAACIAGVFSLEEGLKLVAQRGRLMQELPDLGAMAAIMAEEHVVMDAIGSKQERVSLAAHNGPNSCVISGHREDIKDICATLKESSIKTRYLNVSHAFHSPLMRPMAESFAGYVDKITFLPPQIPLISNLTGEVAGKEITSSEYWVKQTLKPVRFAESMNSLFKQEYKVFIEIGPKPVLLGMGRSCLNETEEDPGMHWLPSLQPGQENWQIILESLTTLYNAGLKVDWHGFDRPYNPSFSPLSTYPFQRERYWVEPDFSNPTASVMDEGDVNEILERLTLDKRFSSVEKQLLPKLVDTIMNYKKQPKPIPPALDLVYHLVWRPQPIEENTPSFQGSWLIFDDVQGTGLELAHRLRQEGGLPYLVRRGKSFQKRDDGSFQVSPDSIDDFKLLLEAIDGKGNPPLDGILHIWNNNTAFSDDITPNDLAAAQIVGCASVLHLVQALLNRYDINTGGETGTGNFPKLWIVTKQAVAIESIPLEPPPALTQSPVWGLAKSIALEHPELWGGSIDLPSGELDTATTLMKEVTHRQHESFVAYRGDVRYVLRLTRYEPPKKQADHFSPDGAFLVTGGMGGLGLHLVKWLINKGVRRLVLVSRHADSQAVKEIAATLERDDLELLVMAADVSKVPDMEGVLNEIDARKWSLTGVFHLAGIVSAQAAEEIQWQGFQDVLAPKVTGTWVLHQVTRDRRLNYFVCFSSIASVWGSKFQTHYGAANHFLDQFISYRRMKGLPAFSINWGPWRDGGMATEADLEQLEDMGVKSLKPDQAMANFEYLIGSEAFQAVVADIDWPQFNGMFTAKRQYPLLQEIAGAANESHIQPVEKSQILQQIEAVPAYQRHDLLLGYVQEEVGKVLGWNDVKLLKSGQGLFDLGMDSFLSIKLKRCLEKGLGQSLSSTIVFDHPTVSKLTDFLYENVLGFGGAKTSDTQSPAQEAEKSRELEATENLSDHDLEALIDNEMESLGLNR
jgi:pimaricinolide synthase PimS1